jgi:sensor domain CHASE-containing protein
LLSKINKAQLVAVTVAVAILGLTASLAHFENMRFKQNERTQVLYQLSYVRAKLESAINVRLQMVDVIAAHASLHPQITQIEFAKIASVMMASGVFL